MTLEGALLIGIVIGSGIGFCLAVILRRLPMDRSVHIPGTVYQPQPGPIPPRPSVPLPPRRTFCPFVDNPATKRGL